MNERIKKLWWKARIGYNEQNCEPEVLERFAELIVKECANTIAHNTANWPGDEGQMAYYQGVQDAVKSIKQHFGVEE